jgi:hypothetical protein
LFEPLSLRNTEPLIAGSRRFVFQHPTEPGLLVKVLKVEKGKKIPWLGLRRPNEMVRSFHREIREFLRIRAKIAEGPVPIARIYGIAETDLGTGLLVEKIASSEGGLAPSLKQYVRAHGFTPELRRLVLALCEELIGLNIVAGDINTNNLVVQDLPGGSRVVVVDGIGDKTFLPVNSFSPELNRRSHERRFARVLARLQSLDSGH